MFQMKKLLAVSLALVLALSLFAGCSLTRSTQKQLVGKWEGKADMTDVMVDALKSETGDSFDFEPDPIYIYAVLTLNADGTYSVEFDEAKTIESMKGMVESMKAPLKETLYQTFEAQGISREDADAAIASSTGMTMDEYVDFTLDELKDEMDIDLDDGNEKGTFTATDSTMTLRNEDGIEDSISFRLEGDRLTLSFSASELDDDLFAGLDKLDFVFDRVN